MSIFANIKNRYAKSKFDSGSYWDERYRSGGTSGAGSYDHLAEFKAEVINDFVAKNKVKKVIEFGCGDGNQLLLADYPEYIGFDVSKKAIEKCESKFVSDKTKRFVHSEEWNGLTGDLALSLDVVYHLIEDDVFNEYMERLFQSSKRFVILYSSDTDVNKANQSIHVRHRNFTGWVSVNKPEWRMIKYLPNKYPVEKYGDAGSFADFYFFEKIKSTVFYEQ